MSRGGRLALVLGCLAGVASLAGGGVWWYRTTRPAYLLRQGQEALRGGDLAGAHQLADRLEAGGAADHAHLLRGEAFFREAGPHLGTPEEHAALPLLQRAVREFNQIHDQGALRLEAAALSGQCILYAKNPAEAARVFRFVLEQKPDHIDAHRGLAAVYYDQGADLLAVRHLEEVARLDPHDGRAHRLMGRIYKERAAQHDKAIPCYREALRRHLSPPVAEQVREELAECLVREGDFAEGLEVLEGSNPPADRQAKVLALRGECLHGLGRPERARSVVEQALTTHPDSLDLLRVSGRLHLDANEARAAARHLARAAALDRSDYRSRHLLALVYERLGRRDEAAEQRRLVEETRERLKKVTQLSGEVASNPWDASLHLRLAELCDQLGKSAEAEMWRRSAAACPRTPQPTTDAPR
jgi:tetratricopeptide (TPR) repeat protein